MASTPEKENQLAAMVAARTTELQRTYDRALSERLRLLLEQDRVRDKLAQAEALISRCRRRAEELGCLEILWDGRAR